MSVVMLSTPVLLLIFNRPDTTQQVFNEIRKAEPKELFVAADGPRKDNPTDERLCQEARNIISQVDWECNVHTLFREENLGCKVAVSSAIDWFFSEVEEGIILEDDCVPDQSFFPFCQELLEYYRDDERIMMIAGTNFLFNRVDIEESYFFSRYYPIWGWATWRRAWSLYDINMREWPKFSMKKYIYKIYSNKKISILLENMFKETYKGNINTWDIQWLFTCIVNNGLSICPKYNLISNVGILGEHSQNASKFHMMPRKKIDPYYLIHPKNIFPNFELDDIMFEEIIKNTFNYKFKFNILFNFLRRIKNEKM